ncbi:MAG: ATP-binding protein [Myxococcaceae bacterium]|nr:ATP-binding protein [Myxococcaceae bacterium]MCI0671828.1 ATP-binding protein [Myxococcaceae bacterium]
MTLRSRLLIAQLPLALALGLVGVLAVSTLRELGEGGQRILQDNYRSVLAAQRMKDALERIDSGALFVAIGERKQGYEQIAQQQPLFERELDVQQSNVTEPGEAEATGELRSHWEAYLEALERYLPLEGQETLRARYLTDLAPRFHATRNAADAVLALNQDAMVAKSEELRRTSKRINMLTITGVLAALLAGLTASAALTRRALHPMAVLSQAVRRLGQGDLEARAQVAATGEIGQLAADFNAMAERLRVYRESSLGELLQAQSSSQAAIDSLPDPVVVFSAEGGVLNVNRAAEQRLGVSVEQVDASLAHVGPELREVLERVRAHVLSGKGPYIPRGYEEAVRVESGEGPLFFLPRGTPVYAETSGIVGATVLLQDVTRLKRFDELKNDLVATVAHEFRTPLTSLRMAIHLCVEEVVGPLTTKQADLLNAAREDCERLQKIVDDLLDLSRIQSGQLELHVRAVSPDELVEEAVAPYRGTAQERQVDLVTFLSPDMDRVEVDPERISVVLGNLVANAVRHSPEGGRVEVALAKGDGAVRFEVSDNGPGIPHEHQARIFDRFYRVPGVDGGAAGLGLSIARDIVRAHGGDIGVMSEEGKGSRFWFTVPERRGLVTA